MKRKIAEFRVLEVKLGNLLQKLEKAYANNEKEDIIKEAGSCILQALTDSEEVANMPGIRAFVEACFLECRHPYEFSIQYLANRITYTPTNLEQLAADIEHRKILVSVFGAEICNRYDAFLKAVESDLSVLDTLKKLTLEIPIVISPETVANEIMRLVCSELDNFDISVPKDKADLFLNRAFYGSEEPDLKELIQEKIENLCKYIVNNNTGREIFVDCE